MLMVSPSIVQTMINFSSTLSSDGRLKGSGLARDFVYLAVILDAWSRRVVGYALGRAIDTRLTLAALRSAIEGRRPRQGCVHHSDRGAQYAAEQYRQLLGDHGPRGSMGRRGNPYDNAKAESFMKTLKTEEVYLGGYETFSHRGQVHRRRF